VFLLLLTSVHSLLETIRSWTHNNEIGEQFVYIRTLNGESPFNKQVLDDILVLDKTTYISRMSLKFICLLSVSSIKLFSSKTKLPK